MSNDDKSLDKSKTSDATNNANGKNSVADAPPPTRLPTAQPKSEEEEKLEKAKAVNKRFQDQGRENALNNNAKETAVFKGNHDEVKKTTAGNLNRG